MTVQMKRAYIEISNACNLSCSFCPSPGITGARQWMNRPLFEATLDSLVGLVKEVYLHVLGEPLLHPQLPEFMSACAAHGFQTNLTTNGVLIQKQSAALLRAETLRQLNFSLHALQEIPQDEALLVLDDILQFTRRMMTERPEVYVNLRLWNEGTDQSCALTAWNTRVRLRIEETLSVSLPAACVDPDDPHEDARKKSQRVEGRLYLQVDTRFDWPEDTKDLVLREQGTCRALKQHCAILVDGRVVACCLDYQGALELGTIQTTGVFGALRTPRAQRMQQGFAQKKLVVPFCQSCTFCQRFS